VASYEIKADIDSQFTGAKSLAVDSTGDFFLCGDSDGAVGVYDLKNSAFTTRSNLGAGAVLDGAWANAKIVVATSSGSVVVAVEGSAQAKFHQHAGAATAIAVHPCGDIAASVGVDKSYVLYDLQSSAVITQIYADSGEFNNIPRLNTLLTKVTELTTITFHPDGHLLAAGAVDGSIKLYDVKTSQLAHTFPAASPAPISAVSFSENGTWLASAHQNQTSAIVWDLRKLNQLLTLDVGTAVTGLTWDYTGQFLAACGPGGVVVNQYEKKSKSWSEPLRRAVKAVGVQWGSKAKSLVALTSEGAVSVLA